MSIGWWCAAPRRSQSARSSTRAAHSELRTKNDPQESTPEFGQPRHRHRRLGRGIIVRADEAALLWLWRGKRAEVEAEVVPGNLITQLGMATEELNRRCLIC